MARSEVTNTESRRSVTVFSPTAESFGLGIRNQTVCWLVLFPKLSAKSFAIQIGRSMSNLISAIAWVKRGVAAQHAEKYVLDDAELARISSLAHIELEDARLELERAQKAAQAMEKTGGEDEAETDAEEKGEEKDESDWVE